jgi:hypothetical protein
MTIVSDICRPSYHTQTIPCSIEFTPDLRRAAQEYRPEVTWISATPGAGLIEAHTDNGIAYRFNCSERDGDVSHNMRDVYVGLGCFKHNEVPSKYIDSSTPAIITYSFTKPKHQLTTNAHPSVV